MTLEQKRRDNLHPVIVSQFVDLAIDMNWNVFNPDLYPAPNNGDWILRWNAELSGYNIGHYVPDSAGNLILDFPYGNAVTQATMLDRLTFARITLLTK